MIINLSIKNEIILHIHDINDLEEAWEKLQSLFDTKSIAKRLMICNKLQGIRMEEGGYMNKFLFMVKDFII
jgi:hypothetical protein